MSVLEYENRVRVCRAIKVEREFTKATKRSRPAARSKMNRLQVGRRFRASAKAARATPTKKVGHAVAWNDSRKFAAETPVEEEGSVTYQESQLDDTAGPDLDFDDEIYKPEGTTDSSSSSSQDKEPEDPISQLCKPDCTNDSSSFSGPDTEPALKEDPTPSKRESISQRARKVQRWPRSLRLVKAVVCVSHLEDGDSPLAGVVQSCGRLGNSVVQGTRGVAKSMRQSGAVKCPPVLLTVGVVGAVVGVAAMTEQKNPGLISTGKGALSHFLLQLEFEDVSNHTMVRRCVLERTSNHGVILIEGVSERTPLVDCLVFKPWVSGITLGDVLSFREQEDEKEYSLHTNNCKHTVHAFVSGVLRNSSYDCFRAFRNKIQKSFIAGLKIDK